MKKLFVIVYVVTTCVIGYVGVNYIDLLNKQIDDLTEVAIKLNEANFELEIENNLQKVNVNNLFNNEDYAVIGMNEDGVETLYCSEETK